MVRRGTWPAALALMLAGGWLQAATPQAAPADMAAFADSAAARAALAAANAAADAAHLRARRLEQEAASAGAEADRAAHEAAAIAARVQQAEADITAAEAHAAVIAGQSRALEADLARRQQPLIQLTAALQRLSRRPLVLSLLRPGTLADTVHSRALIAATLPRISAETAGIRRQLAALRALRGQAQEAAAALRRHQGELAAERGRLGTLEGARRLAARDAHAGADREAEQADALAAHARNLGDLVAGLNAAAALSDRLARLPGPVLRPAAGGASALPAQSAGPEVAAAPQRFALPVTGRLIAGFGGASQGGASQGLSIAARAGAEAAAPAAGKVGFAGPYPGYGQIVIIDHAGGWTSLVTGLAAVDVRAGDAVLAGAPLGVAGPGHPVVGYELHRAGGAVNPLDYLAAGLPG